MRTRIVIPVIALLVAVAAVAATSAVGAGQTDSTVTIKPSHVLVAGDTSPIDGPGVKAIRRGQPIPSGYKIVARDVTLTRGSQAGWGAMRLQCPSGTKTRTIAGHGGVGPQLVGKYHSTWVVVIADYGPAVKPGQTVSGTDYLICR
jgi:hypothetical protein